MGIKLLNKFLRQFHLNEIIEMPIHHLYGKKIAVDASIYLYKCKEDGQLIPNIYFMCSLFRKHNITPIFIFDGKPPIEKKNILIKRKIRKNKAKQQFLQIKEKIKNASQIEKKKLTQQMKILKKKFIRITYQDIQNVKELLDCYGITYLTANGEADILCAQLVINNQVFACLSEDTDLFVHGCPRVLRYFSFINKTVVLYNLHNILKKINLSFEHFKQICILSTNDYNISNKNIFQYYNLFLDFEKSTLNIDFYDWLYHKNLLETSILNLRKINKIFNHNNEKYSINISNKKILFKKLYNLLNSFNFIFIAN